MACPFITTAKRNPKKCRIHFDADYPGITGKITWTKSLDYSKESAPQIRFCAVNTLFIYSWIILQTIHTNRRFLMLQ